MDDDMMMMHMHMPHAANFWIQGNTEATGKGGAYATGGGLVESHHHVKWASHMLDSDPEFNLYDGVSASSRDRQRRRKLSASALTDAMTLFDAAEDGGGSKLLAIGLDVDNLVDARDPATAERLASWVPSKILEAAKDLAALRESPALADVNQKGQDELNSYLHDDEVVTLQIDNEHLDYCGVCETEGVAGKGLDICEVRRPFVSPSTHLLIERYFGLIHPPTYITDGGVVRPLASRSPGGRAGCV